ncbi:MAG: glycosyltransferase family 2 protein [Bacilli bacterium]|nr:glycosyltransferase family 2 protein [Bacilli bacterium]
MSLVSIITPVYNAKKWFKETFESVLNQSFKDFEWIIVDDCSTDNSFDYVSNLVKDYSNFKLIKAEKNGGTAKARNIGLRNAQGRYITFLDADDILDPTYLEEQVKFIKDNGPVVSAGYIRLTPNSRSEFLVPKDVTYKSVLKTCPLSCLTTMYDKDVVGERYFPEDLKKCEDHTFWLDILKDGHVAHGNPKVLATYRILENSKSRNKFKLIKYEFRVYHKTQKINWFKSWYYVFCWAINGKKKYKNVK